MKCKILILTILFVAALGALNGQDKYALLITGDYLASGISISTEQWNNGVGLEPINGYNEFWNDTYLFWEMLYNKEFGNDKIHVLFADGEDYFESHTWVDNRYIPDEIPGVANITDGLSSNTSISSKFSELANAITENDFLFVWVMSHGGTDATGSYFYSYDAQKIYDTQLATWLNGINAHKKTIFLSFPSSGGFTDDLQGDRTIVVTSSQENQAASRADNMSPGGTFTENELLGTNTYSHGEFNYHLYSSLSGNTPYGETTYGAGNIPLTDADINSDGFISVGESKTWDLDQSTTLESQGFSDLSGIVDYTGLEIPTILFGTINQDMLIKGLCGVTLASANFTSGHTVTFDGIIEFTEMETAKIVMDEGSNTIIKKYSEITIPSSFVTINGYLEFGDHVKYKSKLCSMILNQKNDESIYNLDFSNIDEDFYLNVSLNIQTTSFLYIRGAFFHSSTRMIGKPTNIEIDSSVFTKSIINFSDPIDRLNKIRIDSCSFSGDFDYYDNFTSIYLNGYENYAITNSGIINCGRDGITLDYCGYKASTEVPRIIEYNRIFDNYNVPETCTGITINSSFCDIRNNKIERNNIGIISYGNSKVLLEGNPNAVHTDETQEIKHHTYREILCPEESSFPFPFKWNYVQVYNGIKPEIELIVNGDCKKHDIKNNYWGEDYIIYGNYDNYFKPIECFSHSLWYLIPTNNSQTEDEIIYNSAIEQINQNDFISSKETLTHLIANYPDSELSEAAMKDLVTIEPELASNFDNLISFFQNDYNIHENEHLSILAMSLINKCNILDGNYDLALSNYYDLLLDSISYYDSIITLSHIEYVNYLISNSSDYKSSFSTEGILQSVNSVNNHQLAINYNKSLLIRQTDEINESILEGLKNGELTQNFPNPFKGRSTFYFKLNNPGNVEINIYDYLGRLIEKIDMGQKQIGTHEFEFNSSFISNGIYFYDLKVNDYRTDMKKMVVRS